VRLSTRRQFSTVSNASSILTSPPNYADSPPASAVRPGGSLQAAHQELHHLLELSLPFAEVRRDQGYRQPGGVSRRGGHGSAVAWQHLNLLGEYDFSDEKLRDSIGIRPPKLVD
jgi:hypothetical protein